MSGMASVLFALLCLLVVAFKVTMVWVPMLLVALSLAKVAIGEQITAMSLKICIIVFIYLFI